MAQVVSRARVRAAHQRSTVATCPRPTGPGCCRRGVCACPTTRSRKREVPPVGPVGARGGHPVGAHCGLIHNPWVLRFRIPGVMTSSATVPPWPGRPTPVRPTPETAGPPFPRTQVAPPELAPNTPGHIRTDSRAHRGRDRCARVDQELLPAAGDQRRFPRSRFISQAQVGPAFEQHP